jgi:transcriptional regulator with XRE-family HTH domain
MNEQMYSVGPIMKAARKFKRFNQAEVAKAIGCSQSALSKMEHNLLIPSAPQWFLFSRFTSIPPESLEMGIIDRHSPIRFNSSEVSLGFKIPKRYRQQRALKMREIYPFLQFLQKDSPGLVKEFISSTGLDPEFFLDFDNLINFNLISDVINFIIRNKKNETNDVKRIVEIGQNAIYWDDYEYGKNWRKLTSIDELLEAFIKAQPFFQLDFQLVMEKKDLTLMVNYRPEHHIKQLGDGFTEEFHQFLNLYRKYTLENLIKRELDKTVTVEILEPLQFKTLESSLKLDCA